MSKRGQCVVISFSIGVTEGNQCGNLCEKINKSEKIMSPRDGYKNFRVMTYVINNASPHMSGYIAQ